MRPDDFAATIFKAVLAEAPELDPAAIEEVFMGCANQAGEDNRNVARACRRCWRACRPLRSGTTMNRLCGSGMDAVGTAFRAIKAGEMELALAGGVESMSRAPYVMGKADSAFSRGQKIEDTTIGWRLVNPLMKRPTASTPCRRPPRNVAEQFQISREDQDAFALRSQQKAAAAQKAGRFAQEITAIEIPRRKQEPLIFDQDEHLARDHPREARRACPPPSARAAASPPATPPGSTTAPRRCWWQRRAAVEAHGLTPMAKILGMATAGVEPRIMGYGPVPAVNRLLERTGVSLDEIDVIELNEAFAAQALACMRDLGLEDDDPRVNPNGGAIALGHPLGMSGARLLLTAAHELQKSGKRYALCTMCVGVGQGIATLLERSDA